jgi:tricorn protease
MHRHLSLTALILVGGGASAAETPLLLRNPTVSRTQIVFSHAGDLWIASREGGEARRLTSGIGIETQPWFSPDGSQVAFTGEYDGNVDVYVVPAAGGTPRRLTYHPGPDQVQGWTPDGKVLFASGRNSQTGRTQQLFTLAPDGTWPDLLPLPMAHEGSLSPDGKFLAYGPMRRSFEAWKRYRGGTASYIWIADLRDSSIVKVPRKDSNDFNPMWVGKKVYFLSDRTGPIALFAYDTETKQVEPVVKNSGLDFKSASAGPGAIAYEQFGTIHLFDLASGRSRKVDITLHGDMPGVRPRFEPIAGRVSGPSLSPNGARAAFEVRGEIVTVPAEKGSVRNLTNTPGTMERDPAWSPDGKSLAYFSEASGEYALHIKPQNGEGEAKVIKLEPSFYYSPTWSPDSKRIALWDKRLNLWLVDLEKGQPVKADTLVHPDRPGLSWSPDSRWLAYAKPLVSGYHVACVVKAEDGSLHNLTDGLSDVGDPVFDRGGKYLYFTASTNVGPAMSGFDMNAYPHRPTQSVYLAVLKQGDPSPLAPESDEEKVAPEKKDEPRKDEVKPADKTSDKPADKPTDKPVDKKAPPQTTIDFQGMDQRILALPITDRAIAGLAAGKAGTLFVVEAGGGRLDGPSGLTLQKFDFEKRKLDKVMDGFSALEFSATGEKMLYRQGASWFISAAGVPAKPGEGRLRMEEAEVRVEPRAEWAQMFREAWRIERDFFYDPGHHGLDLRAAEKKYAPYVEGLSHREDLNYLFNEMLGDLTVGHLYVRGGDVPSVKRVPGGLLGADLKVENGHYRFAKVYNGENWNPQLRAPLTQPGAEVKTGEYLLAINGRELSGQENPYARLENTSGKQVVLKVGPEPDGKGSREVTIVPVANETALRNLDWIETNRRKVSALSGGKLAYVWLPDTGNGGYTNFNRYWFAQLDRQGAVIDERFNGGGSAADYIIDYLKKPVNSYWALREGIDNRQPFGTLPGPKAMLINEHAGSGGDYMPWLFKRAGLGPLIGKRTWGGLVGIGGYPTLMDGGTITAPHFAFYTPEGRFAIENEGVAPDVEVDLDPKAWREGHDVQLEKAVSVVLEELKKNPPVQTKRPPYPKYPR